MAVETANDVFMYLGDAQDEAQKFAPTEDDEYRVMLNVAGRWTNIKAVAYDKESGIIFIHSED